MKKKREYAIKVNTKKESEAIRELRKKIEQEVIGQDRAIRRLLRATASYFAKLKDPRRPIGGFIFAGPTGVGKTWTAKVFARCFLGGKNKYKDYLTRIDGSSLSQEHEVARLSGAPPGYVGYGEPPVLSQESIDAYHFDVKCGRDNGTLARALREIQEVRSSARARGVPPRLRQQIDPKGIEGLYIIHRPYRSVILFDEIEKAHSKIWNVLLQMMEEGEFRLGKSGKNTNLSHSVIILTTNIGQDDIQDILRINPFKTEAERQKVDKMIYNVVEKRVKKVFPPELFKRLDLIVFRPLKEKDFVKILDNFLIEEEERFNKRISQFSRFSIELEYTARAKNFLLKEGIDIYYGARTLRAVIEKYIRAKIANGITSREIRPGDKILVDEENGEMVFFRKYRKRGQGAIRFRDFKERADEEAKSEIEKAVFGPKSNH